jgi:NAD(P)-dependent dehydrogenase (short-subunit alcohol dehydrogenase family)
MSGKTVVITGASSGIGAAAARQLVDRGATVVPIGRSPERTAAVAAALGVEPLVADFGRLDDVRTLADRLLQRCPTIDVLVHNAGAMIPDRRITQDGFELTFQSNYLAPFLLQQLLHDRLRASTALVVVTSSMGHWLGRVRLDDLEFARRRYTPGRAYTAVKLANLLFTRELARRAPESGISAVAFHPGAVGSNFASDATGATGLVYRTGFGRTLTIASSQGAAPLVYLACLPDPASVNGQYFDQLRGDARTSKQARDHHLGRRLWEAAETMLNLRGPGAVPTLPSP